jgi:Thermostable hemolysin
MVCRLVTRADRLRPLVEGHVRRIYARVHGAAIRSFPELMVADIDEPCGVQCAAGLRQAADGFFSECYVDRPFEEVLSALAAEPVSRSRIIEVANLASGNVRSLSRLIACIVEYARGRGIDWAVFTITPRLERLLRHMKLPPIPICPAQASRVANPGDWGRYYETRPMVMTLPDRGLPAGPELAERRPSIASMAEARWTDPCMPVANVV